MFLRKLFVRVTNGRLIAHPLRWQGQTNYATAPSEKGANRRHVDSETPTSIEEYLIMNKSQTFELWSEGIHKEVVDPEASYASSFVDAEELALLRSFPIPPDQLCSPTERYLDDSSREVKERFVDVPLIYAESGGITRTRTFCQCYGSSTFPYCDGSARSVADSQGLCESQAFTVRFPRTKLVAICRCGATHSRPFCSSLVACCKIGEDEST
jgi:CDGSH-type Zn-finger protein